MRLHRVNGEQKEYPHSEFEAPLDDTRHEVHDQYGVCGQREHEEARPLHGDEDVVEEGRDGHQVAREARDDVVEEDVQQPQHRQDGAEDAQHQLGDRYYRVLALLLQRDLQVGPLSLQQVHRLLEFVVFLAECSLFFAAAPPRLATQVQLLALQVLTDLTQIGRLLAQQLLPRTELGEVHGSGPVDVAEYEVQRDGRQTDAAEQGEQEPAHEAHNADQVDLEAHIHLQHGVFRLAAHRGRLRAVGSDCPVTLDALDGDGGLAEEGKGDADDGRHNDDREAHVEKRRLPRLALGHPLVRVGLVVEGGKRQEDRHEHGDADVHSAPEPLHV
mmetsp:Transcript_19721/g.47800  ORF Transcript_19721/g.47800 Transcript_19721/m.47800 type:complete len:329 (+) Transcript_19721:833-1819(+)